jgi:hypothetical protein
VAQNHRTAVVYQNVTSCFHVRLWLCLRKCIFCGLLFPFSPDTWQVTVRQFLATAKVEIISVKGRNIRGRCSQNVGIIPTHGNTCCFMGLMASVVTLITQNYKAHFPTAQTSMKISSWFSQPHSAEDFIFSIFL